MASRTVARLQAKCRLCPHDDTVKLSMLDTSSRQIGQSGSLAGSAACVCAVVCSSTFHIGSRCTGVLLPLRWCQQESHLCISFASQIHVKYFEGTAER